MKPRDFQFFLSILFSFAATGAAGGLVYGQSELPLQEAGIATAGSSYQESELFKQAVQKFGGPSHFRLIEAGSTGLENWSPPGEIAVKAVVLDWTDKELWVIKPDSTDKVLLPSPRVLSVEVHWQNPSAKQLKELLDGRKYAEAITLGSQLLSTKDESVVLPRWQQRVAISMLVQASTGMHRWERAALLYVSLAKSQSPVLLHASIPIPWTNSSASVRERAKMQELATAWIADPVEAVQLLGAAWLLDGSSRNDAMTTLNRLSKQASETWVRQYAEAQLWRTVAPNQITTETLERWTKTRDGMLPPLQAGPTFLFADKLSAGNQTVRACEEWLRIVILHRDQPFLRDQASLAVRPLLVSIGDNKTLDFLSKQLP